MHQAGFGMETEDGFELQAVGNEFINRSYSTYMLKTDI
jgi:hypothetical protein